MLRGDNPNPYDRKRVPKSTVYFTPSPSPAATKRMPTRQHSHYVPVPFNPIILNKRESLHSILISFGKNFGAAFILKVAFQIPTLLRSKEKVKAALSIAFNQSRFALFISSFCALFKLLIRSSEFTSLSQFVEEKIGYVYSFISPRPAASPVDESPVLKSKQFLAGFASAIPAALFLDGESQVQFAQFLFPSAIDSLMQYRNIAVPYEAMFAVSTAFIYYALLNRPDSLPKAYYHWCVKSSKFSPQANRARTLAMNGSLSTEGFRDKLKSLLKQASPSNKLAIKEYLDSNDASRLPCALLHSKTDSCPSFIVDVFLSAMKAMTPVYFALSGLPLLVKLRKILKSPGSSLFRLTRDSLRSGAFISTLLASFQLGMCGNSYFRPTSLTKYFVFLNALAAGTSIYIEQKGRRAALTLFCLPKAAQTVYATLTEKGFPHIPGIPVFSVAVSMGVIMSLFSAPESQTFLSPSMVSGLNYLLAPGFVVRKRMSTSVKMHVLKEEGKILCAEPDEFDGDLDELDEVEEL